MPLFSDPDLLGAPAPSCAPVLMPLVGHPRFFVMVAVCAPPSAPDAARFRAFLLGVRSGSVWTADEWNERMWWDPDAAAADVEAEGGDGEAKRKRAESEGSASPDGERRPRKRARTEDMGGIAPAPDPFDFAAGLDPPPDLPTLGGPDHSRLRASYEGLHRLCALARRLASIRACERDLNALGVPSELVQLPRQLCYRPCGDNRHADPRTAVLVVRRHYLVSTLQVDLSGRTDGFEDVLDKAGTRGVAGDLAIKVVPSGSGPKLCARFKLAEDGYPPLEFRAPSGPVEASLDKDKREVTLAVGTSGEAPGRELLAAARGMHVLGFLAWQFGAWRGHLDGAGLEAKGMGLVRWEGGAVVFRYTENLTVKVRWTESYRAEAGDDITLAQAASRGSFTASFGSLDGSPNPHAGFEAYYGRMLSEFWDVYRVLKDLQETAPLLGGVADLARLKAFGPVPLFPAPSDRDPGEDLWELHRIAPTLAKLRHRGRGFVLDMLRTETPQLRCVGIFDAAARAFRLGDGRFFPTFENGPLLPIPDVEAKAPVPFMVRLVAEVLALVDDRTLLPDDDAIPMPSTLHENGPPDAGSKLILTVPTAVGNSSAGTAVTTGTAITLPMVPRVAGMISRATVGLEVLDWLEHAVRERFKLGEVRVDRTNIGLTFNTGTLVQNHQPLRAILQIDWKTGAWQCTQLAAVKVEQMVTRRTASAPNALSPGTPGSADARSIPYILPGLKGDAKDTIDVRNTDRELGRLAKWLTSKVG
ncbi:hypothetical protein DFJ74DRAFT_248854 [Hyaloraphidium curvatum]|nr:hypothetical protein DFJ74DRAFT_248854 [Hyaloraphidium curvatum]